MRSISPARGAISVRANSRARHRAVHQCLHPVESSNPGRLFMLLSPLLVMNWPAVFVQPYFPAILSRPCCRHQRALHGGAEFSWPSLMAYARPSATTMVRPGFSTRPSQRKRCPLAGASGLILNSMVSTPASAGIKLKPARPHAESSAVDSMPAWIKPCCCVNAGAQSKLISTSPGATCVAVCAPRLPWPLAAQNFRAQTLQRFLIRHVVSFCLLASHWRGIL